MSEWVEELSKALKEEFSDAPQVCTLATVDKNGSPRARSVVCRKISPDGSLWIVSDARSEKNEQLKAAPNAEVCFWMPNRREQFRVGGSVKIWGGANNEPGRLEVWKGLSDASRALFFWPSPGAKRLDPPESFTPAVDATRPPPSSFEVLILRPRRAEQLQLAAPAPQEAVDAGGELVGGGGLIREARERRGVGEYRGIGIRRVVSSRRGDAPAASRLQL